MNKRKREKNDEEALTTSTFLALCNTKKNNRCILYK